MNGQTAASPRTVAARFVAARRACEGFADYPGPLPTTLDDAYAVQAEAIAQWGTPVVGWKVGRIVGEMAQSLGENRFIGPIFAESVWRVAAGEEATFPVIDGGFGAVEAELIAQVECPAPSGTMSPDEALATVSAWHIGIEVAGSPCGKIDALGPLVSIAAFGNNLGLILGPQVALTDPDDVTCSVILDGVDLASGRAANLPGGPSTAIAYALNKLHALGRTSADRLLISTGAITGVHPVNAGCDCTATFAPGGTIACRTKHARA